MAATLNRDRSDTRDSEGRHFTEILAKKLNYDYFTLARGACSNFAIRLQIDEMIRRKVDLIIVGTTTTNRIEIPSEGNPFIIEDGIYNLNYNTEFYPDRSTLNPDFKNRVTTDTLTNIFTDDRPLVKRLFNRDQALSHPTITEKQLSALDQYLDHLYDPNLKAQIDSYLIHSGIIMLEQSKIPFLFVLGGLGLDNLNIPNFSIDDNVKIISRHSEMNPWGWHQRFPSSTTRRWHTSDEAQVIGADMWYEYLTKHNFLGNI